MKNILNKFLKKSQIEGLKHVGKAFGFSLTAVLFVVLLTNLLYQEKTPLKKGFTIEIVERKPSDLKKVGGVGVGSLPNLAGSSTVDIEDLVKMAEANIKKGKKIFKKCAACHSIKKGAPNKIGPNLHGVIGRAKGSVAGFKYSAGLKNKGGAWDIKDINKLLIKPKDYIPGTKMTFAGLKKDKDRANVIAYLISESK